MNETWSNVIVLVLVSLPLSTIGQTVLRIHTHLYLVLVPHTKNKNWKWITKKRKKTSNGLVAFCIRVRMSIISSVRFCALIEAKGLFAVSPSLLFLSFYFLFCIHTYLHKHIFMYIFVVFGSVSFVCFNWVSVRHLYRCWSSLHGSAVVSSTARTYCLYYYYYYFYFIICVCVFVFCCFLCDIFLFSF